MVHQDNLVKDMLRNIPDPKMREQYGRLLSGEIAQEVHCLSDDVYEDREVPVLDDKGEPVLYKTGKSKGQPKTEVKSVLVRAGCKGRTIAYIGKNGKVTEAEPVSSEDGPNGIYSSGLEGSRIRLDGTLGFRCYCGQNSILLEEEQGIITNRLPSESDLNTIALRLSKRTNIIIPAHIKAQKEGFEVVDVRAAS